MKLTDVCSRLFLYLVTFRRQVRNGVEFDPEQVRAQVIELLAEQERLVREDANLARQYERIKYVLHVLIDEIMINTWSDRWQDRLLEWEFFKTRLAGEEFFSRLQSEGERDPELTEIYYLALCLGFTGKYQDQPEKLRDLRWRLYRMLPDRPGEEERRVTPDAYYVAEGAREPFRPVAGLGRVLVICVALLIGLFSINFFVKRDMVDRIHQLVVEMREDARP